jgi:spoIIIJ-associated protein
MSDETVTQEQLDQIYDVLAEFMEETLIVLDVGADLEADLQHRDGAIYVELDGDRDDIALIIGKRGQTLDAVQYLANAVVTASHGYGVPVFLDAQGYRERRSGQLEKIADRAVAEVMRRGQDVELEPMTASERKVIHLYLKDHPDVATESTGRDPQRRLVVMPRED